MKALLTVLVLALLAECSVHAQNTKALNLRVKIEKVAPIEAGFEVTVSVKNTGKVPAVLAQAVSNERSLQSLDIEQWDDKLGWQSVGPCSCLIPTRTITLAPSQSLVDSLRISDLAHGSFSTTCRKRIENLRGRIRAVLSYVYKSERAFRNSFRSRVPYETFHSADFVLPEDAVQALAATGFRSIAMVQPTYPEEAKKAGVQGTVVLKLSIREDGTVGQVLVLSGPSMLRAAAIDAVRQWRYQPAVRDGKPLEGETTVNVNFVLPNATPPS